MAEEKGSNLPQLRTEAQNQAGNLIQDVEQSRKTLTQSYDDLVNAMGREEQQRNNLFRLLAFAENELRKCGALKGMEQKFTELQEERQRILNSQNEYKKRLDETQQKALELENKNKKLQEDHNNLQETHGKLSEETQQLRNQKAEHETTLQQQQEQLKQHQNQLQQQREQHRKQLQEQESKHAENLKEANATNDALAQEQEQLKKLVETKTQEANEATAQLTKLKEECGKSTTLLNELQKEIKEQETVLQILITRIKEARNLVSKLKPSLYLELYARYPFLTLIRSLFLANVKNVETPVNGRSLSTIVSNVFQSISQTVNQYQKSIAYLRDENKDNPQLQESLTNDLENMEKAFNTWKLNSQVFALIWLLGSGKLQRNQIDVNTLTNNRQFTNQYKTIMNRDFSADFQN